MTTLTTTIDEQTSQLMMMIVINWLLFACSARSDHHRFDGSLGRSLYDWLPVLAVAARQTLMMTPTLHSKNDVSLGRLTVAQRRPTTLSFCLNELRRQTTNKQIDATNEIRKSRRALQILETQKREFIRSLFVVELIGPGRNFFAVRESSKESSIERSTPISQRSSYI